MYKSLGWSFVAALVVVSGCSSTPKKDLEACADMVGDGFRPVASERANRFLGKVQENTARCRGGDKAVAHRDVPWVDWSHYWATADAASKAPDSGTGHLSSNGRGVDGALLDLEYQRMELVKFNLFDNNGTYPDYALGRDGVPGPALKTWPQMRLPNTDSNYTHVGGAGDQLWRLRARSFLLVSGKVASNSTLRAKSVLAEPISGFLMSLQIPLRLRNRMSSPLHSWSPAPPT